MVRKGGMQDDNGHEVTLDTMEDMQASVDFAGLRELHAGGTRTGTADTSNKMVEDTLANRNDEEAKDIPLVERAQPRWIF